MFGSDGVSGAFDGVFLYLLAILVFLAADGHLIFPAFFESFDVLPIGTLAYSEGLVTHIVNAFYQAFAFDLEWISIAVLFLVEVDLVSLQIHASVECIHVGFSHKDSNWSHDCYTFVCVGIKVLIFKQCMNLCLSVSCLGSEQMWNSSLTPGCLQRKKNDAHLKAEGRCPQEGDRYTKSKELNSAVDHFAVLMILSLTGSRIWTGIVGFLLMSVSTIQ